MFTQLLAATLAAILFFVIVWVTAAMITVDPDAAKTDAASGNTATPRPPSTVAATINGNDAARTISTPPVRPAFTATPAERVGVVVTGMKNGQVHLRQAAERNSSSLAAVPEGTRLVIVHEVEYWYFVRLADGCEGWISAAYVEVQR